MIQQQNFQTPDDLLIIFERLSHIISGDLDNIQLLLEYLRTRSEIEENFALQFTNFLKKTQRDHSSCQELVLSEIQSLIKHHANLSKLIQTDFIPPIQAFLQFSKKSQKDHSIQIKSITDSLKQLQKKLNISQSQLERAQLENLHFSIAKNDKSRRVVKELENDVQTIQKQQSSYLNQIIQTSFPKIIDSVTDFDFGIRTTIKNAMINFSTAELKEHEEQGNDVKNTQNFSSNYEPSIETQIIINSLTLSSSSHIYAIARADFYGEEFDDLRFLKGQLIEVFKQHPSGWWEGECNGKKGIFPSTFVEIISDSKTGTLKIGETFEIENFYEPHDETELFLDTGDIVFVDTLQDGWCTGYKINDKKIGKFPSCIVKHVKNIV